MNLEEYEKMFQLEDTYWWFQGRMHLVESILRHFMEREPEPGRVLDLGCGTGLMLDRLKKYRPAGFDFSPRALEFCRNRGLGRLIRGDVVHLPFDSECMDLTLALDLIEHVEHDGLLAAEVYRTLRPGGYFMATVPAHQWLWSDHDVSLHHFRRYSYRGFHGLLEGAGFQFVKYSYAITFSYPPIVFFRMLQKQWQKSIEAPQRTRPKTHLIPLPWFINQPLTDLIRLEGWFLRVVDLPFGISLVALCQKPDR